MWEIAQKELTKSRWPTEFDETGNSFEKVGQLDLNKISMPNSKIYFCSEQKILSLP